MSEPEGGPGYKKMSDQEAFAADPTSVLYSLTELADRTGVPLDTFFEEIRAGRLIVAVSAQAFTNWAISPLTSTELREQMLEFFTAPKH